MWHKTKEEAGMNRVITMKEVERTVNNFWRVQGRYYTTLTESNDSEKIVFSIYDGTDADEVILDLEVLYSECIYELLVSLYDELNEGFYINCEDRENTRTNITFSQYKLVQAFGCEWLEIFEMISEYIKSSYCL